MNMTKNILACLLAVTCLNGPALAQRPSQEKKPPGIDPARVAAATQKYADKQKRKAADDASPSGLTKAEAAALRKEIAELKAEVARLKKLIGQKDVPVDKLDPVSRAIKDGQLMIGMTLDQANKAMGRQGKLIFEDTESHQYEWPVYEEVTTNVGPTGVVSKRSELSYKVVATFEKGKLVSHSRS